MLLKSLPLRNNPIEAGEIERTKLWEEGERDKEIEREERERETKSNYSSSHSRIYPKRESVTHCRKGTHRSYNVKLQLRHSVGWGGGGGRLIVRGMTRTCG